MAELLILAVKIILDLLKCPETKYQVTQLEACQDPIFFGEAVKGELQGKNEVILYSRPFNIC